MLTVTEYMC